MSKPNLLFNKPFFFLHKESEAVYHLSVIIPLQPHVCLDPPPVITYKVGQSRTQVVLNLKYDTTCPNTIRWHRESIQLDGTRNDEDIKIKVKYPPLQPVDDVGYVFTKYDWAEDVPFSNLAPHIYLQKDIKEMYYLHTHIPVATTKKIGYKKDKGIVGDKQEFEFSVVDSGDQVEHLFDTRLFFKTDTEEFIQLTSTNYPKGGIVQHDQADDKPFQG